MTSKFRDGFAWLAFAAALLLPATAPAATSTTGQEKLLIPVGHAQVVMADDVVKTVAIAEPKIADAAVGSERTVVVNGKAPGSTSLVVYGDGGRFRVYEVVVFTPNSDKQVQLGVKVAEVDDGFTRELGLDVAFDGNLHTPGHNDFLTGGLFTSKVSSPTLPLTLGPQTDGAIQFVRDGNVFQATWKALEEKGNIRVLANPTLVARSGEQASFLSGGEFPVPIANSAGSSNGSLGGTVSITIEWKEYGVKVDFLPIVESDGSITLHVAPEVSQLDFTTAVPLNGYVVPAVVTRKTSTTVHLNAGEHLVIGGLKQTERTHVVRRVPILGSLPLIGLLFSDVKSEDKQRDLVIVVSPEILAAATTMPALPTDTPEKR